MKLPRLLLGKTMLSAGISLDSLSTQRMISCESSCSALTRFTCLAAPEMAQSEVSGSFSLSLKTPVLKLRRIKLWAYPRCPKEARIVNARTELDLSSPYRRIIHFNAIFGDRAVRNSIFFLKGNQNNDDSVSVSVTITLRFLVISNVQI